MMRFSLKSKQPAIDAVALKDLHARVMVLDTQATIVAMNSAILSFLTEAEKDLRLALPSFAADELVGRGFDLFQQLAESRLIPAGLDRRHDVTLRIGQRTFDLVVTPLRNGTRLSGYTVEWTDARARIAMLDNAGRLSAVDQAQAVIEFLPDGTILEANQNFLEVMGYTLDEVKGRHHAIFVDPAIKTGRDYIAFWDRLRSGHAVVAQFKRIAKGGSPVWIKGSYNPICDDQGKVAKIVKFATDVTAETVEAAQLKGQISAIRKSQAVITFDLDGRVMESNENFLSAVGYASVEVIGQPHNMFVDAEYRNSREYAEFWAALRRGEFQAGQFKRVGKGGREVWIEASYNPILDADDRPYQVVKFATDVTAQVEQRERIRRMEEQAIAERVEVEARRKTDMIEVANSFERAVGSILNSVTAAATELQATATSMSGIATETASQSTTVAAAAEEAASNVNTVAAAAEELGTSVSEIARQVSGSEQLAGLAVSEADQTATLVKDLSEAARKIGDVVAMISAIASQTNLLALNATIEAARAGAAGRGFAVVATEVKALASQTAQATQEISGHIARIQASTERAVTAIGGITGRIREISSVATSIAAAVEEQGAATQEIVRNVSQAAMGTGEVTSNIAGVAQASEDTGAAASQVLGATSELSRQSEHLAAEVGRFLATVRAA